jgi:hypothetical protein
MKKIILTVAFALGFATAALAADDVMASRYGNTTMVTDATGMVSKVWYNADHTFTGTRGSVAFKGAWKVDNSTVCLTYDTPPKMGNTTMPNPSCHPVQARKVGDTWTVGEGTNKLTVTLVKGH